MMAAPFRFCAFINIAVPQRNSFEIVLRNIGGTGYQPALPMFTASGELWGIRNPTEQASRHYFFRPDPPPFPVFHTPQLSGGRMGYLNVYPGMEASPSR
jgi:hypothetical protein